MNKELCAQMIKRAENTRAACMKTKVVGRCIGIPTRHGDRDVYFYRSSSSVAGAMIVLHGGGFLFGSARNCEPYCLELAKRTSRHVIAFDYTCTPEARWPVALEEVCDGVNYLRENAALFGIDKDRIALGGHSAGANLAAAAAICLKEGTLDKLVLDYPYLDQTDNSLAAQGERAAESTVVFRELYCSESERNDDRVSPIFAGDEVIAKFPQTVVFCAEDDVLRYEGECFAKRLENKGKLGLFRLCKGVQHAFIEHEFDLMRGESDENRRAEAVKVIELTAEFLA